MKMIIMNNHKEQIVILTVHNALISKIRISIINLNIILFNQVINHIVKFYLF